jgi:erythromycin esterase-like protein
MSTNAREATLQAALRDTVEPLMHSGALESVLSLIDEARFVMIGEASHGTAEFYATRAEITQRLIEEKGFNAVAVEADWPDAYRVNRFVRHCSGDANANLALSDFERFPTWMWRNDVVWRFVDWLREHNATRAPEERAGFYGLDLYSLHASVEAVLKYLDARDPVAATAARHRYRCFDHFGDPHEYGLASRISLLDSCEADVVHELLELQQRAGIYARMDGEEAADEYFFAVQNARVVQNAEEYYRTMYRGGTDSWNLRDTHMADTLDELIQHLSRGGSPAKVVVWAHNSHLGDARATDVARRGEINLGQLIRERHSGETFSLGFTSYDGTVTAADDWGDPPQHMRVRPALADSYEALFHGVGVPNFLLNLRDLGEAAGALTEERLTRMIGVVYRPQTERWSHYFHASMPRQFDAIIHYDRTRAVQPLEAGAFWHPEEPAETYPSGL